MENLWKMVGGAVIAGVALGYCYSEQAHKSQNNPDLEEMAQKPAPSAKPKLQQQSNSTYPMPQYQELEESRQQNRKYPEETKPKQEANSYGLPSVIGFGLPDFSEEDEWERPWYNLPEEERNFQKGEEIAKYFNAALDAEDYMIADSYITNFLKFILPEKQEEQKKAFAYVIASNYISYLTEVIGNCQNYNFESVFRKVIWMNIFLANHQEILPIHDISTERELDLFALTEKGETALEAVEYCKYP